VPIIVLIVLVLMLTENVLLPPLDFMSMILLLLNLVLMIVKLVPKIWPVP